MSSVWVKGTASGKDVLIEAGDDGTVLANRGKLRVKFAEDRRGKVYDYAQNKVAVWNEQTDGYYERKQARVEAEQGMSPRKRARVDPPAGRVWLQTLPLDLLQLSASKLPDHDLCQVAQSTQFLRKMLDKRVQERKMASFFEITQIFDVQLPPSGPGPRGKHTEFVCDFSGRALGLPRHNMHELRFVRRLLPSGDYVFTAHHPSGFACAVRPNKAGEAFFIDSMELVMLAGTKASFGSWAYEYDERQLNSVLDASQHVMPIHCKLLPRIRGKPRGSGSRNILLTVKTVRTLLAQFAPKYEVQCRGTTYYLAEKSESEED